MLVVLVVVVVVVVVVAVVVMYNISAYFSDASQNFPMHKISLVSI